MKHPVGREVSGHGRDAAQVGSREPLVLPHPERQEPDPQHRFAQGAAREALVGTRGFRAGHPGMEERLQVHGHRLIAGGNQVFEMEVHGPDGVKKSQQASQADVISVNVFSRGAWRRGNELDPAIASPVQDR